MAALMWHVHCFYLKTAARSQKAEQSHTNHRQSSMPKGTSPIGEGEAANINKQ